MSRKKIKNGINRQFQTINIFAALMSIRSSFFIGDDLFLHST